MAMTLDCRSVLTVSPRIQSRQSSYPPRERTTDETRGGRDIADELRPQNTNRPQLRNGETRPPVIRDVIVKELLLYTEDVSITVAAVNSA